MYLQLDGESKKLLEATQKELGAVRAAVTSADENASVDSACGGQLRQTVLDLYSRNAKIKVCHATGNNLSENNCTSILTEG